VLDAAIPLVNMLESARTGTFNPKETAESAQNALSSLATLQLIYPSRDTLKLLNASTESCPPGGGEANLQQCCPFSLWPFILTENKRPYGDILNPMCGHG